MITHPSTKSKASAFHSFTLKSMACLTLLFLGVHLHHSTASAQAVLFDFDSAGLHSDLPLNQSAGGITAHLSATSPGYSIQDANVLGFTPAGFAGRIIYPNSISLADLFIRFDLSLSDFSIMYCCQELGCDDAATMRVTAFRSGSLVGTNTRTTSHPGTWPVDTLSCSFAQGFDSVVVHYDSPPPTCKDYGTIFMADNMTVTPATPTGVRDQQVVIEGLSIPNPIRRSATISLSLARAQHVHLRVYDITGRLVTSLFDGQGYPGTQQIRWDAMGGELTSGVYFLNMTGENISRVYKLIVVK